MCRAYKWHYHTGFFMRNSEIGKSALTKQSAIHLTRHPSIHPIPSIFRFWPLVYGAVRERKRYSLHAHSLSISNQENVSRCLFKVSIYLACNWWDTKREGWSLGAAAAAAHTTIGVSTRLILGTTVFVMYPVVWTERIGLVGRTFVPLVNEESVQFAYWLHITLNWKNILFSVLFFLRK